MLFAGWSFWLLGFWDLGVNENMGGGKGKEKVAEVILVGQEHNQLN